MKNEQRRYTIKEIKRYRDNEKKWGRKEYYYTWVFAALTVGSIYGVLKLKSMNISLDNITLGSIPLNEQLTIYWSTLTVIGASVCLIGLIEIIAEKMNCKRAAEYLEYLLEMDKLEQEEDKESGVEHARKQR